MAQELVGLLSLVQKLRRECPWDREQTPETIKTYLLEECYEALEALDSGDPKALRDELGDLLFQVFFLATLAQERGWFDLEEVAATVARKMTDRHPHVFGETKAANAAEVKKGWETRKRKEADAGADPLGSIPASLPAVAAAYRMTSRAADLGFDWERDSDVAKKIEEEIEEWRQAAAQGDRRAEESEIGDLPSRPSISPAAPSIPKRPEHQCAIPLEVRRRSAGGRFGTPRTKLSGRARCSLGEAKKRK
jgi:MazG family protein